MEVFWRKKEKQKEGTERSNEIFQRKEEQISKKEISNLSLHRTVTQTLYIYTCMYTIYFDRRAYTYSD